LLKLLQLDCLHAKKVASLTSREPAFIHPNKVI